MRRAPWLMSAAMVAGLQAQEPARATPAALLAELTAPETSVARRGELYAELCWRDFRTVARELARCIERHPFRSGIGPSTDEPWREERLAPEDRVAFTLRALWRRRVHQEPGHDVLLDVLEDAEAGHFRSWVLADVMRPARPNTPATPDVDIAPATLERVHRAARDDASPAFRAHAVAGLLEVDDANCLVDLAIAIAKSEREVRLEAETLWWTNILFHTDELLPAARGRLLLYAFDLLRRADARNPPAGWNLDGQLVRACREAFGPERLSDSSGKGFQARRAAALAWAARRAPPAAGDRRPWIGLDDVLAARTEGTATLRGKPRTRLDGVALTTAGRIAFTASELAPLLPDRPIAPGDRWTVPGSQLAAFAAVLGSVEWRASHADDGAYRDWRGRHRLDRQLTIGGGLDAICERRGEQVGIALHGNLVVDERVRVSIRSGPDQLTATAKHTVSGWLALGADGRPTSIELRDDVETDGRFGGPYGDAFTQRASWSTAGPDVLTAAEQHAVTELIAAAAAGTGGDAGLGANVLAYRGAGARLTAMGRLVVPAIVDACCGSTDHTARQRLTAVLRAIAGDAM